MFIVLGMYNFGFKKGKEVVSPCFWYKCDIKQKKLLAVLDHEPLDKLL